MKTVYNGYRHLPTLTKSSQVTLNVQENNTIRNLNSESSNWQVCSRFSPARIDYRIRNFAPISKLE